MKILQYLDRMKEILYQKDEIPTKKLVQLSEIVDRVYQEALKEEPLEVEQPMTRDGEMNE